MELFPAIVFETHVVTQDASEGVEEDETILLYVHLCARKCFDVREFTISGVYVHFWLNKYKNCSKVLCYNLF